MKYYKDVVLPKMESGEILHYELQKTYILQEGFMRNGKRVLPITYVADFYIEYANGESEVIDVKGCPDSSAKIKRKLFWKKYPDIEYKWVAYLKKFGGWGDYDEYRRMKQDIKRQERIERNKSDGKQNQF